MFKTISSLFFTLFVFFKIWIEDSVFNYVIFTTSWLRNLICHHQVSKIKEVNNKSLRRVSSVHCLVSLWLQIFSVLQNSQGLYFREIKFLLKNTKHIRSIDAIYVSFNNVQLQNDCISQQGNSNWMCSLQKEKQEWFWTISDILWSI